MGDGFVLTRLPIELTRPKSLALAPADMLADDDAPALFVAPYSDYLLVHDFLSWPCSCLVLAVGDVGRP